MKSLFYKFTLVLAVLCIASTAFAQTPTPHPDALDYGVYQLEDAGSYGMSVLGAGWSISSGAPGGFLQTSNSGSSITFYVEDVDSLLLHNSSDTNVSNFSVCIEYVCRGYKNPDDIWDIYALDVSPNNAYIQIINTDTRISRFDYVVLNPVISAVSGTSGSLPTATPNPAIITGTISGISGTYATEFHMIVTAGDVAITSALLFLFISLITAVLVGLLFSDVR